MGWGLRLRNGALLTLLVGCMSDSAASSGAPSGVSQVVDAAGGTVAFEGVVVTIPEGALDGPQTITIARSTAAPPPGATLLAPMYQFGPEGLQFKLPVTVSMAFDGDGADAVIYWSTANGDFEQSSDDVWENKVTTRQLHFSNGVPGKANGPSRPLSCAGNFGVDPASLRAKCWYGQGDVCLVPTGPKAFPIQYVFVLMHENHSFDNYFGRFPAYLAKRRPGDWRAQPGAIEVPPDPYDARTPQDQAAQDKVLDLCKYDPKKDAPFNPAKAGTHPNGKCQKHYWRHANGDGEQCVSDTCHEWWCAHLEVDGGRMDGFFQANDGFWEGGEPDVGYGPYNVLPAQQKFPADWYSRAAKPDDGTLLRGDRAMLYYDERDIPFYYWLADSFGLADHYHSSLIGPTFPNRDYLYAATSRGVTSNSSNDYGSEALWGLLGNVPGGLRAAGDETADPPARTIALPLKLAAWKIFSLTLNTLYDALVAGDVTYAQWVRNRYSDITAAARWASWYGGTAVLPASPWNPKYTYDKQKGNPGDGFEATVQEENRRLKEAIEVQKKVPWRLGPQGALPRVNFIDPDKLEDVNGEDEHPQATPQTGQRLSYDVVRVLLENPEVWKRSVVFITWDEHGGLYDHVSPPKQGDGSGAPACAPDNIGPANHWSGAYGGGDKTHYSVPSSHTPRQDSTLVDDTDSQYGGGFDQYGVRVPLLVISPWLDYSKSVSHHFYDHTSIVRFIEARFGLPALTKRDANADALFDFFDFSSVPEKLGAKPPAAPACLACDAQKRWGSESLPTDPVYADAAKMGKGAQGPNETKDAYEKRRYYLKANDACLALFPPSPMVGSLDNPLPGTANNLGAKMYGGYDYSRGIAPPKPLDCSSGTDGGGPDNCTCPPKTCSNTSKWCQSTCSCALAQLCPAGSIPYQCPCCLAIDYLNMICLSCVPPDNVFPTYCPGG